MTGPAALLDELRRSGLAVTVVEERLEVSPGSKLTPAQRKALDRHWRDVVALLREEEAAGRDHDGEAALYDWLIESWRTHRPLLDHTVREIEHVARSGHEVGDPPPLAPGEPVPGCTCTKCGGTEAEPRPSRGSEEWMARVEAARSVPIIDVVDRLGCGEPQQRGQELMMLCPLHEDTKPSLRLQVDEGVWYCDVCAEGGDGIDLVRRALQVDFVGAVEWLTN